MFHHKNTNKNNYYQIIKLSNYQIIKYNNNNNNNNNNNTIIQRILN